MRRIVAAVVALVLAGAGGVTLMTWVAGADRRALAGLETAEVLVVTAPVAEGTSADRLDKLVARKTLPVMAVASGAVRELAALQGLVADGTLQPGEQLLSTRFVDPATQGPQPVTVPPGLQEVSVQLEAQRALGGDLAAGATVGVLLTTKDERTRLALHRVLVTKVQGATAPAAGTTTEETEDGSAEASAAPLPTTAVLVTLAVTAAQAERVVHTAEHGSIWLSRENQASATAGTAVVTSETVLR